MMKNQIPHIKIEITEIPYEKKPNTVNPHVPLHERLKTNGTAIKIAKETTNSQ